jgi:hypothetical protein
MFGNTGPSVFIPTLGWPSLILLGLGGGGSHRLSRALFLNWALPSGLSGELLPHFVSDIQSRCFWNKAPYFPIGYPHENSESRVTNPGFLLGDQRKKQCRKKNDVKRAQMRNGTKRKIRLNNWSEDKVAYWTTTQWLLSRPKWRGDTLTIMDGLLCGLRVFEDRT